MTSVKSLLLTFIISLASYALHSQQQQDLGLAHTDFVLYAANDQLSLEKLSQTTSFLEKLENDEIEFEQVDITDELTSFFSYENQPCDFLPKKIKKKLNKQYKESGWLPRVVKSSFDGIPKTVNRIEGKGTPVLLHTLTLKLKSGLEENFVIRSSPTYKNFDIQGYTDPHSSNYLYYLSCAGYLDAAIEASGTIPAAADMKTSFSSSIGSDEFIMVAMATAYSPLLAAIRPKTYGTDFNVNDSLQFEIISSILGSLPSNLDEGTEIEILKTVDLIWTSRAGKSSIAANGNYRVSGGGTFGVASINMSSSGRGSLGLKINFADYDTYLLGVVPISSLNPITIKEVKGRMENLKNKLANK